MMSERGADVRAQISAMRTPVRGVPLHVVVRELSGCAVEKIDPADPRDMALMAGLQSAVVAAAQKIKRTPIVRRRANEVGNAVEPFVAAALTEQGFRVEAPRSRGDVTRGVGYPDLLMFDADGRPTYIECKTFSADTANTTMRSFYLSPSGEFKVCHDARHLVVSFQMVSHAAAGGLAYSPVSYKIVDLYDLKCDVKFEFNSDNRRMYARTLMLAQGQV